MGIRKKGSRNITVDGVQYRYYIVEDKDDCIGLNVCIQRVKPAGQRLMSWFRKPTVWTEVAIGRWSSQTIPHCITPQVIRQLILTGLEEGWCPAESGLSPFYLPGNQIVSELPAPVCRKFADNDRPVEPR